MGEHWWSDVPRYKNNIKPGGSESYSRASCIAGFNVVPVGTTKGRLLKEGQQFGLWTVLGYAPSKEAYACLCEGCGRIKTVQAAHVLDRGAASCKECYNKYRGIAVALGVPKKDCRRLSNRFYAARARCTDPCDKKFKDYGARGIECRFTRESFLEHVIQLEGWDNPKLDLDRADNDGHYEVGNIRFVTRSKQNSNKRTNTVLFFNGRKYTATEFYQEVATGYAAASTVVRKVKEGLTAEEILWDQIYCTGARLRRKVGT